MVLNHEQLLARLRASPLRHHAGYSTVEFPAMGTVNRLIFRAPTQRQAAAFWEAGLVWLAGFEARYSTFIPDSLISRINRAAGGEWVETDPETMQLFALVDWFHWKSEGILDPTVGPLLKLWDYHEPRTALPGDDDIERAMALTGWPAVERSAGRVRLPRAGMSLDLGGIGKEYAVDRVMKLADEHNVRDILVDLGRDLRVAGAPPEGGVWRIGLEHPDSPGHCWAGFGLKDAALCASGIYQRYFAVDGVRYSHIIDPRKGRPVMTGVKAAWVSAASATEAGVLSTCALALGADEGLALVRQCWGAEACIWCGDEVHQTRRFTEHVLEEQRVGA